MASPARPGPPLRRAGRCFLVFLLYQKGRDSRIFQAPATADRLRHRHRLSRRIAAARRAGRVAAGTAAERGSFRIYAPARGGIEETAARAAKAGVRAGQPRGSDLPPRHPLIEGMFQSLPENGQPWTLDEAADWLHAAAYNLRFAYKLEGKIKIEIEVERQAGE